MPRISRKRQVSALPVKGKPGDYLVLLITSRETQRWIIPKGWPMRGRKDYQAAAQEAYEEAGVSGRIHKHPVGAYNYTKAEDGSEIKVMVYLLQVDTEHENWPERPERRREWMPASEAARRVETGLVEIVERLDVAPVDG